MRYIALLLSTISIHISLYGGVSYVPMVSDVEIEMLLDSLPDSVAVVLPTEKKKNKKQILIICCNCTTEALSFCNLDNYTYYIDTYYTHILYKKNP